MSQITSIHTSKLSDSDKTSNLVPGSPMGGVCLSSNRNGSFFMDSQMEDA